MARTFANRISLLCFLAAVAACTSTSVSPTETETSVATIISSTQTSEPTQSATVQVANQTLTADSNGVIRDVRFQSGNITLVGELDLPEGEGPFPVIVWVHGSGPSTREEGSIVGVDLIRAGFAVFRYDKRGVGDSGGNFGEVSVNGSKRTIPILAGDAAAAVEFLAQRPEIDAAHIGLFGSSQAGWIIPYAAGLSEQVSFIAMISGPAVSVGLESYFSQLSGNQNGFLTDEQIDSLSARLKHPPSRVGFDPREVIEALDIPALWVLGARDGSIPVRETAAILEEIKAALSKDITIFIYPEANHFLFNKSGGRAAFMQEVIVPWFLEVTKE